MFGGFGLYLDGRFFAVISDGVLYFRTDDATRERYLARDMEPLQPKFRPRGPKTVDRHFAVPEDVFADDDTLREWALCAAATCPTKRPRKRKR
jgi:DNA transformation protein